MHFPSWVESFHEMNPAPVFSAQFDLRMTLTAHCPLDPWPCHSRSHLVWIFHSSPFQSIPWSLELYGMVYQNWAWTGQDHDDVIKWWHFPSQLPFARGIHQSPVNYPHKGQWCWALMFSLICVWTNSWINNEAGDLGRHRAHYDVTVMCWWQNWATYYLPLGCTLILGLVLSHNCTYAKYTISILYFD